MKFKLLFLLTFLISSAAFAQTSELPREWIDPDTGHRIVRLSEEPGSQTFYFHQYAYTEGGDKLVFSTRSGLSTYDFKTKKIEQIVQAKKFKAYEDSLMAAAKVEKTP